MYKATRDFLKARGKYCESSLVVAKHVQQLGTGDLNKCLQNSRRFVKEKQANGEDYISVSGWLVMPYDKVSNSTEIIQHWWVADANGKQYDTTPNIWDGVEYVLDFNLNNYAYTNYDRIASCVAMSLLYKDGKFHQLTDPEQMEFVEIKELKTELLFKYIT